MNQSIIDVKEGKYAIGLQALKKDSNEPSVMADYLSQKAIITKQDGVLTLSLLFQSQQTITGFQVEHQSGKFIEAIEQQINEEMDRRFEMFKLDKLPATLNVRVQYEVKQNGQSFKGDEALRLAFIEEALEKLA